MVLMYKGIHIVYTIMQCTNVSFVRRLRVELKTDNGCAIRNPAIEFSQEMNAPDYSIITYVSEI